MVRTWSFEYIKSFRYMQYLTGVSAALAICSTSAYSAWTSPVLPQLTSYSATQVSWIASSYLLGALPGGVLGGWLMGKLGRKWSIILVVTILLFPWIAIGLSDNPTVIITVRFMAGICAGVIITIVPVYIAEVTDKDIRGRLGTLYTISSISGSVIILSVGPFISYKMLSIVGAVFPVLCGTSMLLFPESPYYLIQSGKSEEARKSIARLCCNNVDLADIQHRLTQIEKLVQSNKKKVSVKDVICKYNYRKPLLILLGLKTIQHLNGYFAINVYMETIFRLSQTSLPPYVSSIIYGTIQLPSAILSAFLVDKLGRRPLLIISASGCGIALILEGIYFYLHDMETVDLSSLFWFPTFALTMYITMIPIGLSSVPMIILGELFTPNAKGVVGSISTFYGSTLAFTVVKVFDTLIQAVGIYTVFWMFAFVCVIGIFYGIFILPETKGKSFQEIQDLLMEKPCATDIELRRARKLTWIKGIRTTRG